MRRNQRVSISAANNKLIANNNGKGKPNGKKQRGQAAGGAAALAGRAGTTTKNNRATKDIKGEMKRQCMDLKQEIYHQWEQNIMSNNIFSPQVRRATTAVATPVDVAKPKTGVPIASSLPGRDDPTTTTAAAARNNNEEEEEGGPLDEADSDGSDHDGAEAQLEEDSVMSQTQAFKVPTRTMSSGSNDDAMPLNDEAIDVISGNAGTSLLYGVPSSRALPSKAVSRSAIPPLHAPMKLEEAVEPAPPTIGTGDPPALAPAPAPTAAAPARSSPVQAAPSPPPLRVISPPLPLYNFKSPVKPMAAGRDGGLGQSGDRVWQPKPPKTGINMPLIWPPPYHIRYVPPTGEPLYVRREQLVPDMLLKDAERLSKPDLVLNRVVYDSIEPNAAQGATADSTKPAPRPSAAMGAGPGGDSVDLPAYYQLNDPLDDTLVFESRFESGNLRRAIQVYPGEYDLIIKPDINTRGHTQWFYFSVSNVKKGRKYKFNCINLYKGDSLYNRGMQPLIYSLKGAQDGKVGWVRRGEEVCYYQNHIKRRGGYYYTATFTVDFPHDDDTVFMAYCFPYTYSDLQRYLCALEKDPKRSNRFRRRPLCQTLAGNNCDLLTITSFACDAASLKARKGVVITARVHPGESNSSYMMKGVIDYLTGPSLDAKILRDNFVFKVVPMLNPDGVIVGNYRCSLAGVDLNRNWDNPSRKLHPTIYYTKNMIRRFMEDREVILFTDFHGHSRKMNVFMYGCENKAKLSMRLRERIFPRILWKNSSIFSYADCSFNVGRNKESTGRVVGFKDLGLANSYTMEASFCGADFGRRAERHFTVVQLEEMGHYFCDTILDYCDPDQTKVQNTLRELYALSPSDKNNAASNIFDNVRKSATKDDSDGDDAADDSGGPSGGGKGRGKRGKGSVGSKKKTKADRADRRKEGGGGKEKKGTKGKSGNKGSGGAGRDDGETGGKKKRMRRRASLPSSKASSTDESGAAIGRNRSKSKIAKAKAKKVELSVEQALAQADAVLSSLVANPPSSIRKGQAAAGKAIARPLSASKAVEASGHGDSLRRLEKDHSRRRTTYDAKPSVVANGAGNVPSGAHTRSSLAQAGRHALKGWGAPK